MTVLVPAGVRRAGLTLVLAVSPLRALAIPPQATGAPPTSLERIRQQVAEAPTPAIDIRVPPPRVVAVFRVEAAKPHVLTLEEQLHKAFDLTPQQRQAQEWQSRCCGLDFDVLVKPIGRALKRRQERRIREQIARELAELKAAAR